MFYQFNLDTQANFDQADFLEPQEGKHHSLPTTTHNSPTSDHSILDHSLESNDCSFQEEMRNTHADNVWIASVRYIKNTFYGEVDEQKGINGLASSQDAFEGGLEQAVRNNSLLRSRERSKLLLELQREGELCGLLAQLMMIFSAPVFHELLFVVHNIWQSHYLPYRQSRNSRGFLTQFKAFVGWEGQEQAVEGVNTLSSDYGEVNQQAQEGLEELAHELFYSKKLRILNLAGKVGTKNKKVLEKEFLELLKAISRAVFLSAEGFYGEESISSAFAWEEEAECSQLEGRFVRAISQIQADHENLHLASKRRKYE